MSITIKELPELERPYEKMEMYGAESLSNSELLAIIIKSGTKEKTSVQIAQEVLLKSLTNENNSLRSLQNITVKELMSIKGLGKVKALQIKAVCEIAKRMSVPMKQNITIKTPENVADILMEELRYEKREIIKLILLNSKNLIIRMKNVSIGSTNQALIDIKDILQEAIICGAPKMILVHNHPSGDSNPSKEDINTTRNILEISRILGIQLLDHIVIGDGNFTSIFRKMYIDNNRLGEE